MCSMPLLILQVSASGDDATIINNDTLIGDDAILSIGNSFGSVLDVAALFAGISGLAGATIVAADYQLFGSNAAQVDALTNLFAEDAASPVTPTSGADYSSRVRTTAFVPWDVTVPDNAWSSAPDMSAVLQELVDDHDPSSILILHEDDGSTFQKRLQASSYDSDTSLAPKLDIDYTLPDPGDLNVLDGEVSIPDGTTTPRDFGSVAVGASAPQKTFTVENLGDLTITISGVTVPTGYEIDASSDLDAGADSIAASASKSLVVNLVTGTAGTFAGDIEIASGDEDEATYNFAVTGEVSIPSAATGGIVYDLVSDLIYDLCRDLA
jgi:hypothetical protein